jgi:hypothetical protein
VLYVREVLICEGKRRNEAKNGIRKGVEVRRMKPRGNRKYRIVRRKKHRRLMNSGTVDEGNTCME